MQDRTFRIVLIASMAAALAVRLAYVMAQASGDPSFDQPILDGAFYLDWARGRLGQGVAVEGAYYLAPLYGYLLAAVLGTVGESFTALYLIQHGLMVASAAMLALVGRRLVGPVAGLSAAGLLVLYHPALFFASRPLGEPVAIFLLAAALYVLEGRNEVWRGGAAGWLCGIAALARPNFLLVPLAWGLLALRRRRWWAAALVVAGSVVAVLPVATRNALVSGHLVPVSSNMGLTFLHGNAPGARGTYTLSKGFSGRMESQRREATLLAGLQTGTELDPVQADRWWGRQALKHRLDHPADTVRLQASKLFLLLADEEICLGYAPFLDDNPWRWAAPVPFAVLLGLAVTALAFLGVRDSGGGSAWVAVLSCAAATWIFYVSSRYRLPAAALLCLPAGTALAAIIERGGWARRAGMVATAVGIAGLSWVIPTGAQVASTEAVALAGRAVAWKEVGDLDAAERDLQRALSIDSRCVLAWFNRGVVAEARGWEENAESYYLRALGLDPGHAESAGNLGRLLIRRGEFEAAATILRRALTSRPYHAVAHTNLVVALVARGDLDGARTAAREASRLGVALDPGLLTSVGIAPEPSAVEE